MFSTSLEDDPHVFFRGVSEGEYLSVLKGDFKSQNSAGTVSFAKKSKDTLMYIAKLRLPLKKPAYILAVRFDDLTKISDDGPYSHLANFDEQPTAIGFMKLPTGFNYF